MQCSYCARLGNTYVWHTHQFWINLGRTRRGGGTKATLCYRTVLSTVRAPVLSRPFQKTGRSSSQSATLLRARACVFLSVHQAADPKVYFDSRLGENGAWVMIYFGTCPLWKGASINIAFSLDLLSWHKASEPLYKAGGHPAGLDKCEAHKVWTSVCLCLSFCFCLCL